MDAPDYYVTVRTLASTEEAPRGPSGERVVAGIALIAVVAIVVTVSWVVVSTIVRALQALADAPPLISI